MLQLFLRIFIYNVAQSNLSLYIKPLFESLRLYKQEIKSLNNFLQVVIKPILRETVASKKRCYI